MMSGLKLAGSIDSGLDDLRTQETALAEHLRGAVARVNELRTAQAGAYRELASMRLTDIDKGAVTHALDEAEARALALLKQSDKEQTATAAKLERARDAVAAIEGDMDAQAKAIAAADAELDAAEAKLQSALAKRQDYRDQAAATETAARVADEAERKTELAENDRAEKGKPYEADPLFMYLWERGFGTSTYRSWGLIKMLDQWVAKLCDYHTARPNYAMLLEIPERLRTHRDRVAEAAEQAVQALEALEQSARDDAGVTALEKNLEQQESKQTELGEKLAQAQATVTGFEQELGKFERGEDDDTVAALDVVAAELRQDTLRRLQHEAYLTPDPRDDEIVARVEDLGIQIDQAEEDVAMRQEGLRVLAQRRAELETVRTDFRNKRYNTDDFQFDDHGALEALLEGLLRGAVTGTQYWRELERNSRRRKRRKSSSNFGSRNYRRSSTTWSRPSRTPGSFRTGGTMTRSSGFKTGGGF